MNKNDKKNTDRYGGTGSPALKAAFYGMFLAVALVTSYIERFLPVQPGIPGVKLGLANVVTMILLYTLGVRPAAAVTFMRIILSGFLFGTGFAMVYSAAGAAFSMAAMLALKATGRFSSVGVSLGGGVFHNVGQILVAAVVLETGTLVYYLPVLILSGLGAGTLIGILSGILTNRLAPVIRQAFFEQ